MGEVPEGEVRESDLASHTVQFNEQKTLRKAVL